MVGEVFGRLTVIERAEGYSHPHWWCMCECGNRWITSGDTLRRGRARSCGCLKIGVNKKHGHAAGGIISVTYRRWRSIKSRCRTPKDRGYHAYGAIGIDVCDRWFDSFEAFLEDMGECPDGAVIKRRDHKLDYEPDNCYWAQRSSAR